MPINAPLRDRTVSKRHLTFPTKFKGGNATVVSNVTTTPNPAVISREYIAAVVISLTNITLSGAQTIDDISITAGMTVLVNGQTDKSENGPYICENTGWTRVSDINMISGFLVVVRQGTSNANTLWMESLEFDFYTQDVTELEWVNVAPLPDPPEVEVDDTDSVYLTVTDGVLTADVRRQNTSTADLTIDASGLRVDVKYQESNYTQVVTSDFGGAMINLKHQDSDTVQIIQTFDGIECEVIEDSIDTFHLADESVTIEKLDVDILARIKKWWRRISLAGSGLTGGSLTWTVPSPGFSPPYNCLPPKVFFCYVRATFTQVTSFQPVNNAQSPTLSINAETVNTSPYFIPSPGSSDRLVNVCITGARIIDFRSTDPADRYIDVVIALPNGTSQTAIGQMELFEIEETEDQGEWDTYTPE